MPMSDTSSRIVICGAGIAGIAAAYYLAVKEGQKHVVLVEQGDPLSLTSDKSTECYRNWWPMKPRERPGKAGTQVKPRERPGKAGTQGPDMAMTGFMNRSIDLLEQIALESDNRINLNRRGYVFATAEPAKIPMLTGAAQDAARLGAGPLRLHDSPSSSYRPSPAQGFDFPLTGADLLTDAALIRQHFPYLSEQTIAVLHARRAGWFGSQQLGMYLLEKAREHGVQLIRGRVTGVDTSGGQVNSVEIEGQQRQSIKAHAFVIAAGPMQKEVAGLLGIDLPVYAEHHSKMSFSEHLGVVPRHAPMLIWLDDQYLPWSDEERALLTEDKSTRKLLDPLPWGVHCRPEGHGNTLLVLFNHHVEAVPPVFPLPQDPHYPEVALRGISTMVPGLKAYFEKLPKPWIDGGYYIKTRENRPLIGPLPVAGAHIVGALSGFGIMAACAAGELLARHIAQAPLPEYAPAFLLSRYSDPEYLGLLEGWGDGGQL
jgi:glycine/D-amino acid oxidase-like deaminating enzyme